MTGFPPAPGVSFPGYGDFDASTVPLAGRELPADMVQQLSGMTLGQLFHILNHIKKLQAKAPQLAQAMLAENPQICHALLHAECLTGLIEDPMLPMTAEELKLARVRARQMQEELAEHQLPPPATAAPPPPPPPSLFSPSPVQFAQSMVPPADANPVTQQKQQLMKKLVKLTPDQIKQLPEGTKVALLKFLQQQSAP
mmetsp:Transcript_21922/g.50067  ORF Transcript_21922/g.50067 Transcript_21922/m.50067 type:complete len:197 (-) Transcript_21922:68-658(-)